MHNGPLGKPENARKTPVEPGEADRLEAPAKDQGRLVVADHASGEERTRDSAMFNLAIHSELRDCDVVRLKVEDVARMA
jgi:integrase